jgi:hypothetical protein
MVPLIPEIDLISVMSACLAVYEIFERLLGNCLVHEFF